MLNTNYSSHFRLNNVVMGTEQTLKMRDSGKELSVIGDGRLEASLMDGFHSASAVQSIKDPRVQAFSKEFFTAKDEPFKFGVDAHELVKKHLGEKWSGTRGERDEVIAVHTDGNSEMRLQVTKASGNKTALSATVTTSETRLTQGIEMREGRQPTEFLIWEPSLENSKKAFERHNQSLARHAESLS